MKKWNSFMILCITFLSLQPVNAQRRLSQAENQWVYEAKRDIEKAITQSEMNENVRLQLIEKGARTLKQYGQAPYHIPSKIPYLEITESRYVVTQSQIFDSQKLYSALNIELLNQRVKVVNSMQIDLAGEQIKFLLPGNTIYSLSSDVVSSVFTFDYVNGASGGQRSDANELKNKFLNIAKKQDFITKLMQLEKDHRVKLEKIHKEIEYITDLEKKIKHTYDIAERTTSTFNEYDGAIFDESQINAKTHNYDRAIVGIWTYNAIGFKVVHVYNADGTAMIRVNTKVNEFKWETSPNNLITYYYPDGKDYTMSYKVEGNQLFYGSKNHKGYGHPLTKQ